MWVATLKKKKKKKKLFGFGMFLPPGIGLVHACIQKELSVVYFD